MICRRVQLTVAPSLTFALFLYCIDDVICYNCVNEALLDLLD